MMKNGYLNGSIIGGISNAAYDDREGSEPREAVRQEGLDNMGNMTNGPHKILGPRTTEIKGQIEITTQSGRRRDHLTQSNIIFRRPLKADEAAEAATHGPGG